ncbi:MAG: cell division ATP-binding protein FtsE [candidate division KSB1 bacterium]|nr:cell division ATP-binding protein FtsE [candidate division KSB1 bacterium]MDQ7065478.1 cell division ATP-binding protein FtsE [candidate division KSB1 bacterium]
MKIIRMKNVQMRYPNGEGLKQVNLTVEQGEFVFLVGPSGAGKSTVLKLIYMQERPGLGQVQVGQFNSAKIRPRDIPYLRRQLGIVFQDFRLLEDRNVFENVAFALRVIGTRPKEIKKRVLRVLGDVGISHKRYQMPYHLSGGEQQRVAIARALVNEPMVLLADEPTGNLDPQTAEEIMQLLEEINMRGTAVLMATHNYDLVKRYNHRVVRIEGGVTLD